MKKLVVLLVFVLAGCAPKIIERRVPPTICFNGTLQRADGQFVPILACFDARDVNDWKVLRTPPVPPEPETVPEPKIGPSTERR